MPLKSPVEATTSSQSTDASVTAYSMQSRNTFPPFNNISSSSHHQHHVANPVMSAAAAAALLIQAAASGGSGSVTGDDSSSETRSIRKCSTNSLLESPQPSPPLSAVFSAAAQLAAIGTSFALAAQNSPQPNSNSPSTSALDPNSTVNSVLNNLSEHHTDFLNSNPTLASVFRRRSSTILPSYYTNTAQDENSVVERRPSTVDPNITDPRPFIAPKIFEQPTTSNLNHDPYVNNAFEPSSPRPHHSFEPHLVDHFQQQPIYSVHQQHCDLMSTAVSSSNRIDPNSSATEAAGYNNYTCLTSTAFGETSTVGSKLQSAVDLISHRPNVDATTDHPCRSMAAAPTLSNSPLSYSSLSDGTPSKGPLSPSLLHSSLASDGVNSRLTAMSSTSRMKKHSDGDTSNYDDRSVITGYSGEDSGRKREQRLMKNREAARECRRKKKEYVKCLEARVNLLEDQNQRLIEELQKVKALCLIAKSASADSVGASSPSSVVTAPVTSKRGSRRPRGSSSSTYQPSDASLLAKSDTSSSYLSPDASYSNRDYLTARAGDSSSHRQQPDDDGGFAPTPSSTNPALFQHPHYAAKRGYLAVNNNDSNRIMPPPCKVDRTDQSRVITTDAPS